MQFVNNRDLTPPFLQVLRMGDSLPIERDEVPIRRAGWTGLPATQPFPKGGEPGDPGKGYLGAQILLLQEFEVRIAKEECPRPRAYLRFSNRPRPRQAESEFEEADPQGGPDPVTSSAEPWSLRGNGAKRKGNEISWPDHSSGEDRRGSISAEARLGQRLPTESNSGGLSSSGGFLF